MRNLCGDPAFHGCPASLYLNCEAYKLGINCWEAPKKPCCQSTDLSKCVSCRTYTACVKIT